MNCKHLWSEPDQNGLIECLWCNKVAKSPKIITTDTTKPEEGAWNEQWPTDTIR